MGILSTRKQKRALVVLAALAAPVALLAAPATPASADYCVPTSQAYWTCYPGNPPVREISQPNRDVDIGER
jgi:hypothetical protein